MAVIGLKFGGWVIAGTKWTRMVPHKGFRAMGGAW